MQQSMFDDEPAPAPPPRARGREPVRAAPVDPAVQKLAGQLPPRVHLGTSSWTFPGWGALVWDGTPSDAVLARHGLAAYAGHPLLRSVSIDRSFYRPLTAAQYAGFARQVPPDFRFVVKAPSLVADAQVRDESGRGLQPNPAFLDPALAVQEFVAPALEGLGPTLGALVFQLSPLPIGLKLHMPDLLARLDALLDALPPLAPMAPEAVVAVEVRDREWLTPAFVDVLRRHRAVYCLGLHPRLPPIDEQLPLLRALWPGPLVCRWSLHRRHGARGYDEAKAQYAPFDRLVDPDPATRQALARVAAATAAAGHAVLVTINNKAEGSGPLSVLALAQAIVEQAGTPVAPRSA